LFVRFKPCEALAPTANRIASRRLPSRISRLSIHQFCSFAKTTPRSSEAEEWRGFC
jgi:hypothetical protein